MRDYQKFIINRLESKIKHPAMWTRAMWTRGSYEEVELQCLSLLQLLYASMIQIPQEVDVAWIKDDYVDRFQPAYRPKGIHDHILPGSTREAEWRESMRQWFTDIQAQFPAKAKLHREDPANKDKYAHTKEDTAA